MPKQRAFKSHKTLKSQSSLVNSTSLALRTNIEPSHFPAVTIIAVAKFVLLVLSHPIKTATFFVNSAPFQKWTWTVEIWHSEEMIALVQKSLEVALGCSQWRGCHLIQKVRRLSAGTRSGRSLMEKSRRSQIWKTSWQQALVRTSKRSARLQLWLKALSRWIHRVIQLILQWAKQKSS